eukprot:12529391-Ditylum_brightwellii.AAC.1
MANVNIDACQDYWHNKQQGEEVLPNLEHSFEDYDPTDIYQCELSVLMWYCSPTLLTSINKVGNKARTMLMKLQSTHGKANFELFNEQYERIKLETFPKKAED